MKLRKLYSIFALIIFFCLLSCGRKATKIPPEFIETSPPKIGSDEWRYLKQSLNVFGVKIIDDKLIIKKADRKNQCILKVNNGTLFGTDNGEWSGELSFIPDDATKKTIVIKRGNIKYIFYYKDKVYFIEGLAHMFYSGGAIYRLNSLDNNFSWTKLVDFEDAPEAYTIYKDKLLVVTCKNFYIVNNFKKDLVFRDAFWDDLNPNSIVAFDDKDVFIGIRSGIVKLDLESKTIKFYKNDK